MERLSSLTAQYEAGERARKFLEYVRAVARHESGPFDRDLEVFHKAAVSAMTTGNTEDLRRQSRDFVNLVERATVLGQLPGTVKVGPYTGVPIQPMNPRPHLSRRAPRRP